MHGNGYYSMYAQGKTLFSGNGASGYSEETKFTVDPMDFFMAGMDTIINDESESGSNTVDVPTPNDNRPRPTYKPTLEPPKPETYFCGNTYADAESSCRLPCPTRSPSDCPEDTHTCYRSTTCRERWAPPTLFPTEGPTVKPTRAPTPRPTAYPTRRPTPNPTPFPTPYPTRYPTPRPTPRPNEPVSTPREESPDNTNTATFITPTPKPTPRAEAQTVERNRWFCGESWDWVTSHCDEAVPCPNGDAGVCPDRQACFASTPCTPMPTPFPTRTPTKQPTNRPTGIPTKAPWNEDKFFDFLYGELEDDNNGGGEGGVSNQNQADNQNQGSNQNQNQGNESSNSNNNNSENDSDPLLASDINDAMENYNELQYHFFCGYSWHHSDQTCGMFCPSGDRSDCPDGMQVSHFIYLYCLFFIYLLFLTFVEIIENVTQAICLLFA